METKKLYRSRTNRFICGVCGGIGEYLNIDPTIIRLLLVLLAFTGTGILAYFIAAIIIPDEY
ncbi:PspC domain-containing protein [Konateibacter massiliensis]|uniref:PspC domain-containing protein n=1 Tax=Konateibacter massiliensis TaxID=2002841 RepID=UPI000C144E95|nr:PspC domain-containing protein [Konateibacter massiliensis]